MFPKELMLIKQANQRSQIFFTIGIFYAKGLSFSHMYAIDVTSDIAISKINSVD